MLQCKNGRLYFDVESQTMSFAIPDGFWIETEPYENSRNVIELRTANKAIEVEIDAWERGEESAEKDLRKRFNEAPPECLTEISPFDVKNGVKVKNEAGTETVEKAGRVIHGYSVMCFDGENVEYAAVLDVAPFGFMQDEMRIQQVNVTAMIRENCGKKMKKAEAEAAVEKLLTDSGVMKLIHSVHVE